MDDFDISAEEGIVTICMGDHGGGAIYVSASLDMTKCVKPLRHLATRTVVLSRPNGAF